MKFMVSWDVHPDKRLDVLQKWCSMTPEERGYGGEGVTLVGRWHNSAEMTGVGIFEANDLAALYRYLGQWNPVMDLVVAPVLDDEESAAVGCQVLADLGG